MACFAVDIVQGHHLLSHIQQRIWLHIASIALILIIKTWYIKAVKLEYFT